MDFLETIIIAIGLAMDASAVSLVVASAGYANNFKAKFRLSFHFGLFQFFMPVVGWLLGISFVSSFSKIDHWIGFFLLSFVGGRMIISGLNPSVESYSKDPSRGFTLIMLSFATSIDALAIGLSLAMLNANIWYPSVIIGTVTASLSLLAINIGKKIKASFSKKIEIFGGIILILLGLKILIEHLSNSFLF